MTALKYKVRPTPKRSTLRGKKLQKTMNTKTRFIILCNCRSYLVGHKNMPSGGILQISTLEVWICVPSSQRNCTNHTETQPYRTQEVS